MSEPTQTTTAATLSVSEEVQKKFPELVEMIKGSRSMNTEERQYWVDVLLIMDDGQIQNLRNILENERKQIEAANQSLKMGVAEDESKLKVHFDEIKYREKKRILKEAEGKYETEEREHEAALLQEIGKM
jgi:hypothetical protein